MVIYVRIAVTIISVALWATEIAPPSIFGCSFSEEQARRMDFLSAPIIYEFGSDPNDSSGAELVIVCFGVNGFRANVLRISGSGHCAEISLFYDSGTTHGSNRVLRRWQLSNHVLAKIRQASLPRNENGDFPVEHHLDVMLLSGGAITKRSYDRRSLPDSITTLLSQIEPAHIELFGAAVRNVDRLKSIDSVKGNGVAISADARYVGVYGRLPGIHVVDLTKEQGGGVTYSLPCRGIKSVGIASDGKTIAAIGADGLYLSCNMGVVFVAEVSESAHIIDVTVGNTILVMDRNRVTAFNVSDSQMAVIHSIESATSRWLSFNTRTKRGIVADKIDGHIAAYERDRLVGILLRTTTEQHIEARVAPDGNYVALYCQSKEGRHFGVFAIGDGNRKQQVPLKLRDIALPDNVRKLVWSPDGKYVAGLCNHRAIGIPNVIEVWSRESGRHVAKLVGAGSGIVDVASTSCNSICGLTSDGRLLLWSWELIGK